MKIDHLLQKMKKIISEIIKIKVKTRIVSVLQVLLVSRPIAIYKTIVRMKNLLEEVPIIFNQVKLGMM